MLLAFEVWPSPLSLSLRAPAFTAKGRFCPRAFLRPAGRIPVIRFVCKRPLMSCVVVLMMRPEALKEVANVLLKTRVM